MPGISHFHELNVRTYVVRNGIPGVWFFSLDAASSIAVAVARAGWGLPYHKAQMQIREVDGWIHYTSERRWPAPKPACFRAAYRVTGDLARPRVAEPGTLEHFLVERYVLFAPTADGSLRMGRVHHQPYPLVDVEVAEIEHNMIEAAGLTRTSDEILAHYCAGVDVDVYALQATSA